MLLPNYSPQEVVFTGVASRSAQAFRKIYYCKFLILKTSTRNRVFDRTDKTDMYRGNINNSHDAICTRYTIHYSIN